MFVNYVLVYMPIAILLFILGGIKCPYRRILTFVYN